MGGAVATGCRQVAAQVVWVVLFDPKLLTPYADLEAGSVESDVGR